MRATAHLARAIAAALFLASVPGPILAQEWIAVDDTEGFLRAIGSGSRIELAPGRYDLGSATDLGSGSLRWDRS